MEHSLVFSCSAETGCRTRELLVLSFNGVGCTACSLPPSTAEIQLKSLCYMHDDNEVINELFSTIPAQLQGEMRRCLILESWHVVKWTLSRTNYLSSRFSDGQETLRDNILPYTVSSVSQLNYCIHLTSHRETRPRVQLLTRAPLLS